MKLKPVLTIYLFTCFLFNVQQSYAQERLSDGVLFEIKKQKETDAQMIKVQVLSEEIIHVIASPEKTFSSRRSLMVEKTNWEPNDWFMQENDNYVEISTSKIKVRVNKDNGAITFFDSEGKIILQEKADDGKIITPAKVMGEETYHIQQLFKSPEDEAFYGLGQHQNDLMNYKGHDVDLWQLNIVAAIPFLVSSKNYGILWDNNSRTKFGDIRDYQSLSDFKLYGKDNQPGGLTAEY